MNLPNSLTLSRIFLVPVFLTVLLSGDFELTLGGFVMNEDWLALAIFLSAAATDFLDGYIARSRGEVTTLGKLLDPIADKLLISAAFISLVELDRVPAWVVVVIVGREFAVSGLRYIALTEGIAISASGLGKGKMAAQVTAVALLLVEPYGELFRVLAYPALTVAVVLTVLSMLDYFRGFWGAGDNAKARKDMDLIVLPESEKRDAS
jgi:CDP-diacylglycerol--glycerol-3-phosphate 3-phosphatidyltransferase